MWYNQAVKQKMADKQAVTTREIVFHFGLTETTAKRYLRALTVFGYLKAMGSNKNRRYKIISDLK